MKLREILQDVANGQTISLDVTVTVASLGSLGGPGLAARGLAITDGDSKWKLWVSATFPVSTGDSLKLEGLFMVTKVLGMRQIYPNFEKGAVVRNTRTGAVDPPPKPTVPHVPAPTLQRQDAFPVAQVYVKETIREIVKVPCRYCGFLNVNTDPRCSSCGAPTK